MKPNSVVASFVYVLSGGEYDLEDATPLAFQAGTCTQGPLEIGEDCWLRPGAARRDGGRDRPARRRGDDPGAGRGPGPSRGRLTLTRLPGLAESVTGGFRVGVSA